MADMKNIIIYDAIIKWRNFSGREAQYNPAGIRKFSVVLEPMLADRLARDGWNVKWLEPKNEGEDRLPHIPVFVSFKIKPPKIVIISSNGKTVLTEETCGLLDFAEIEKVDLAITPSKWEMPGGKTGIKAYLKSIYVTIVEDELEQMYYDTPGSVTDAIGGCGNCEECDGACGCDPIT